MADAYPAQDVTLAGNDPDNVLILDADTKRAIGEIDREASITTVHEGAIYQVEGEAWKVERFDYQNRRAYVRLVDTDYFTEAETDTEVAVLRLERSRLRRLQGQEDYAVFAGEVHVTTLATQYKKVRFYTRESVGAEDIHLPPEELDTQSFCLTLSEESAAQLDWSVGDRGAAWAGVGKLVRRVAPLFVRCQPQDLGLATHVKSKHFRRPTIYLYDRVQGGVGLADALFNDHREILLAALEVVRNCECGHGCPACVNPQQTSAVLAKTTAQRILEHLVQGPEASEEEALPEVAAGQDRGAGPSVSAEPDLRARLARLTRSNEVPRGPGPGRNEAATLPPELRRRLNGRASARALPKPRGPARTLGPPRDLEEHPAAAGAFSARTTRLGIDAGHGNWSLAEVEHAVGSTLARVGGDAAFAGVEWRRAVYLDIETTGLGGGAGVHCFMIGLGSFVGGCFELWQGFLRGPEESASLLAECSRRIAEAECVVSFFGKSFDRHRLEDQMRCFGIQAPFASRPHLDLYHACRRLYGSAFEDGRLATMERELCGLERVDDLSGAHAPEAWFDFLAGREHALEEVFRHNYLDVLSLVTLCAHLGRSESEQRADGRPLGGPDLDRAQGLARCYFNERDREQALLWIRRAQERGATTEERTRRLGLFEADCLRLLKRRSEAREAYLSLSRGQDGVAARSLFEAARLLAREARAAACPRVHRTGGAPGARHLGRYRAHALAQRAEGSANARLQRGVAGRLTPCAASSVAGNPWPPARCGSVSGGGGPASSESPWARVAKICSWASVCSSEVSTRKTRCTGWLSIASQSRPSFEIPRATTGRNKLGSLAWGTAIPEPVPVPMLCSRAWTARPIESGSGMRRTRATCATNSSMAPSRVSALNSGHDQLARKQLEHVERRAAPQDGSEGRSDQEGRDDRGHHQSHEHLLADPHRPPGRRSRAARPWGRRGCGPRQSASGRTRASVRTTCRDRRRRTCRPPRGSRPTAPCWGRRCAAKSTCRQMPAKNNGTKMASTI